MAVSGLPSGVTAVWGQNPTASSSQLYLYATHAVAAGQYPLNITGTSGSTTNSATLTLTVAAPGFTLPSFGTTTLGTGTTDSAYVEIQREYGFSGAIAMSISGLPSGVTASFSPNPVTGTGSFSSSEITLQASASAAPGQYTATVTGVSGGQTVTTSFPLVIAVPGFSLYSNDLAVGQGLSGTTYVYLSQLYGFGGAVNLSVSGLPSGVTATFAANPTTSYANPVTFNVGSTVPVGQYPVTITGTSGSLTQTVTLTLTVGTPSFTLSAYPVTAGQGKVTSTWVSINSLNGFNGAVTLSVSGLPGGVTASFGTNPTTVYSSQLTFNVGSTVPAGQYPLIITGTSGTATQTTALTLTVGTPSFTLYGASSPTFGQGSSDTGYVYLQAQNGFSGSVNLSVSGLPSGVTADFSTNPMTSNSQILFTVAKTAAVGSSTLTITGTSGSETETTSMTLTIAAPTFTIYGPYSVSLNQGSSATSYAGVFPQNGFTGNVTLSASGLPDGVTATFSPVATTGSSTMTLSATGTATPGTASFTITGTSGSITSSLQAQVVVNASNFSLSAAPGAIFARQGASGKSTINIVPINGFAGSVHLSVSGLPAGVTATLSPTTATTGSTLILSVGSTAAAGSTTVTVTGNSGAETASTPLLLTIRNSSGTATTTTVALTAGGAAVSTVAQGVPVTATASVSAGSSPVTAGVVYLCDAGAAYCDGAHQIATAQLNVHGNAVFRFVPGVGQRTCQAVFAGTTANFSSSSSPAALTVTGSLPTSTTLAQSGTTGDYTLSAAVTGVGAVAPSGTVSFLDTTNHDAVLASAATVANAGASTVSILLGSGSGTWTAGSVLQTEAAPGSIAYGDFNRDGRLDLAVVIPSSGSVAIFLGNGDGTFAASSATVYVPPQASGIVAADLNGDGFEDLAVLSPGSSSVTVLLGHGDGSFTPDPLSASAGPAPVSVVQGDFNGDGIADLAITNDSYTGSAGSVTILLGDGDGSFTAAPALASTAFPYSIVVGDFNQDGKQDLAVGANGGAAVNVFLGNGDGTFTAAPDALTTGYAMSLAVADVNEDGRQDLIVADASSSALTALLGNGDGTFTKGAVLTLPAQPESLVAGDWNGDGVVDFAVVSYDGGSATTVTTQLSHTVTATANGVASSGAGVQLVAATYPGDGDYAGSTSNAVSLTGDRVTPNVALTLSSSTLSMTTPLTVSVQVTSPENSLPGAPSGTVTLTSGSYSSAAATLSSGAGAITVPPGTLAAGTDALTIRYTPDTAGASLYTTATATASVVVQGAPAITWPAPAAITYGTALSSVQLDATSSAGGTFLYAPAAGTVLPAGAHQLSVTFTPADTNVPGTTGSVVLHVNQAALSLGANDAARVYGTANPTLSGTLSGAVRGDLFTETFSTPATVSSPAGTYAIVPSVSGASLPDYTVTAANGTLTISPAPTTTTFSLSNQNLLLTATVLSTSAGAATGPVTFYAGQTQLGSATLSGGIASLALTSFPGGDVSLRAQYAGDGNFAASTSASMPVLAVTAASTSLTVAAAGSATDALSVAVPSGYAGTLQFSCTGLPQNASCSFQPGTISFSGTGSSASTMLTLTTGSQARLDPALPGSATTHAARWAVLFVLPGLLPLFATGRRRMRAALRASLLVVLLGAGVWFTGCASGGAGGSGSGSGSGGTSTPGTPSGNYTIQIVASSSSGVSQSTAVTVTVQ